MTSRATDRATRELFGAESRFGLGAEEVFFLEQHEAPCVDLAGELMLAGPACLATNPDGHGGVLAALRDAGAFAHMQARGVESLFFYQVDNPLVRIGDPVLVGFQEGAEVATKVVEKRTPDDRLGTLSIRAGRTEVVEYTEVREPERSLRLPDGRLAFWAGTIGIHCFARAFLERCAARAEELLPYHLSPKRIEAPVAPPEPNGYKLERFAFDLLPHARRVVGVEAPREEEFAPVKNASGGESPQTARAALTMCYRRWLEAAGLEVPAGARIEIDHSWADGPDEVRAHGLTSVGQAPGKIAIEMGGTA
jgi:UDP-N-acetylglucosamine/UDP-N-acetylgalactosamine diphosphorylase